MYLDHIPSEEREALVKKLEEVMSQGEKYLNEDEESPRTDVDDLLDEIAAAIYRIRRSLAL